MLKILIFQVVKGWKGKKWPKMLKISVCRTLCFRNHISYDLHLWCTWIISPGIFFIFCKILILGSLGEGEVKGQKMAQNDKKFCLSHSVSHCTSYDCNFLHTCVKWWYLQQIFTFFKILIFGVFSGIKGKKWPNITNFSLFCSISQKL